ncbi:hypothetical protein [Paenibacillus silvisoli]|uniref:hypothetical protein n=1 Tax=Paenibacillus silvisoli TaxID=3110539 RepID=UPI0028042A1C|nr:hypothetical protein [Paenibacillus silvisoli]
MDGEIAGFVFLKLDVRQTYLSLSTAEKANVISEFFIMRKFRGHGVGRTVACSLFDQFPGQWEVRQTVGNKPAYAFWKQVISKYKQDGAYQEEGSRAERKMEWSCIYVQLAKLALIF